MEHGIAVGGVENRRHDGGWANERAGRSGAILCVGEARSRHAGIRLVGIGNRRHGGHRQVTLIRSAGWLLLECGCRGAAVLDCWCGHALRRAIHRHCVHRLIVIGWGRAVICRCRAIISRSSRIVGRCASVICRCRRIAGRSTNVICLRCTVAGAVRCGGNSATAGGTTGGRRGHRRRGVIRAAVIRSRSARAASRRGSVIQLRHDRAVGCIGHHHRPANVRRHRLHRRLRSAARIATAHRLARRDGNALILRRVIGLRHVAHLLRANVARWRHILRGVRRRSAG